MPRVTRQELSKTQERRIDALEPRIARGERDLHAAQAAWAAAVRKIGISAVARRMGLEPQTVRERVMVIERRAER